VRVGEDCLGLRRDLHSAGRLLSGGYSGRSSS
jgi:hypothetical protein